MFLWVKALNFAPGHERLWNETAHGQGQLGQGLDEALSTWLYWKNPGSALSKWANLFTIGCLMRGFFCTAGPSTWLMDSRSTTWLRNSIGSIGIAVSNGAAWPMETAVLGTITGASQSQKCMDPWHANCAIAIASVFISLAARCCW